MFCISLKDEGVAIPTGVSAANEFGLWFVRKILIPIYAYECGLWSKFEMVQFSSLICSFHACIYLCLAYFSGKLFVKRIWESIGEQGILYIYSQARPRFH